MKNGLPVRSDQIDLSERDAPLAARRKRSARKFLSQRKIQPADFLRGGRRPIRQAQNVFTQASWNFDVMMPLKLCGN
jgi:hypothetical protein